MTNQSGQGANQSNGDRPPYGDIADMWKPWIDMMSAWTGASVPNAGQNSDSQSVDSDTQDILNVMAQAYRLAMANGMRYWTRIAEANTRY